jgi:hypothetical protein
MLDITKESTTFSIYKVLWTLKMPLRIKVFWLVVRNRILTKENLLKKGGRK